MKTRIIYMLFLLTAVVALNACTSTTTIRTAGPAKPAHVPPGQAKKATGSQSAKEHAPGQQKKKKK